MSRATVRSAIAAFFAPPAVAHLDVMYAWAPAPFLNKAANLAFPTNAHDLGWAILFFDQDTEIRLGTSNGSGGCKEMRYAVRLELVYRSRSDAEKAQAEFDDFLDSLRARIRTNRQLGAPSVIFEAGEGEFGIQGEYREPQMIPTSRLVTCQASVRFDVTEMVSG
jgi:hypothetical protein